MTKSLLAALAAALLLAACTDPGHPCLNGHTMGSGDVLADMAKHCPHLR